MCIRDSAYARGVGALVLGTFRPATKLDERLTLGDAGLVPRAALTASPVVDPNAVDARTVSEKAMDAARDRGRRDKAEARAKRDATERKLKEQRLQRVRDTERQRADALRGFGADREDKNEQIQRERRAIALRKQRLVEGTRSLARLPRCLLLTAPLFGRRARRASTRARGSHPSKSQQRGWADDVRARVCK